MFTFKGANPPSRVIAMLSDTPTPIVIFDQTIITCQLWDHIISTYFEVRNFHKCMIVGASFSKIERDEYKRSLSLTHTLVTQFVHSWYDLYALRIDHTFKFSKSLGVCHKGKKIQLLSYVLVVMNEDTKVLRAEIVPSVGHKDTIPVLKIRNFHEVSRNITLMWFRNLQDYEYKCMIVGASFSKIERDEYERSLSLTHTLVTQFVHSWYDLYALRIDHTFKFSKLLGVYHKGKKIQLLSYVLVVMNEDTKVFRAEILPSVGHKDTIPVLKSMIKTPGKKMATQARFLFTDNVANDGPAEENLFCFLLNYNIAYMYKFRSMQLKLTSYVIATAKVKKNPPESNLARVFVSFHLFLCLLFNYDGCSALLPIPKFRIIVEDSTACQSVQ
ncbi:hypothetical protein PROFUN_16887, partial [Planoprotostelium fungivorum]